MTTRDRSVLLIAAAQSAATAAGELLRTMREEDVIDAEVLAQLLDAAKCTLEACDSRDEETEQVYRAIAKYLEGWAP